MGLLGIVAYVKINTLAYCHKKRLIETVLMSFHNICFGYEMRKLSIYSSLLSRGLYQVLTCIGV